MVTRSAAPPTPHRKPPPFCGVGCGGVDWEGVGSPSLLGVGSCGWKSPSLFPPCGVGSGGWESPSCGVGFGGVEFVLGSLCEVESVVLPEWGLLVLVKLL